MGTAGREIEISTIVYHKLYVEMVKAKKKPTQVGREIGVNAHTILRKMRGRTAWTLWEAIAIKKAIGSELPLEELFVEG